MEKKPEYKQDTYDAVNKPLSSIWKENKDEGIGGLFGDAVRIVPGSGEPMPSPGKASSKTLLGGGFDEKIRAMAEEDQKRAVGSLYGEKPFVGLASQAQTQQKKEYVQPQHRNTGHASVRLSGPEAGKVTMLGTNGGASGGGENATARNARERIPAAGAPTP